MKVSIVIVTLFSVLLLPAFSLAERGSGRRAKAEFKAGVRLYENGDFVEAAEKFRSSYEIKPSYRILYNLGQAEAAARRYGISLQAFEKYLGDGGDDIPLNRQKEVRDEINRLRDLTGVIEVTAPEGAEIFIDGVSRGTFPATRRLPVASGVVHDIAIRTRDDVQPPVRQASVFGGDTVSVDFTQSETVSDSAKPVDGSEASVVGPTADMPTAEESETTQDIQLTDTLRRRQQSRNRKLFISGIAVGSVGVASLIAGGIFGGLALSRNGEVENECPGGHCLDADRDLVETRDRFAVMNTIFLATGSVLTATGGIMIFLARKKEKLLRQNSHVRGDKDGKAATLNSKAKRPRHMHTSVFATPLGIAFTGRF